MKDSNAWHGTLVLFVGLLGLVLFLAACAPREPGKLTVGLLPIIDSLPFYVAEEEGYFRDEGLEVELITFASALERDAALQAGQLDGQLADLIASGLLNRERGRIKIVKTTYKATPQTAMISLVAGPKSNIRSPQEIQGARVGISENSIIDYITDRLLQEAGMDPKDIEKVGIPKIPVRMQMLVQGQLDAATLPEPLVTLAVQGGGRVILDDGAGEIGLSVLEFRIELLQQQRDLIRRFVRAHERAVEAVNRDPEKYRPLLSERARLPESLKETFPVPAFPQEMVPSREDVDQAVRWMVRRGLLPRPIPYDRLVDTSFVQR